MLGTTAAAAARPQADIEALADVINRARYPASREPRALAEEDRSGQAYARRIAKAVAEFLDIKLEN